MPVPVVEEVLRAGSCLSRLHRLGRTLWPWAGVLAAKYPPMATLCQFTRWGRGLVCWEAQDNVLRVELAGRHVLYMYVGDRSTARALREAVVLYATVYVLDQYCALQYLRPGMTVLDIGANIGTFSLLASELVGECGRVVAVEPVARNFDCLAMLVTANALDNITCVRSAAGNTDGSLRMKLAREGGQHSVLEAQIDDSVGYEEVDCARIDSIASRVGLDRVDFLKMDVEGFEPQALAGAEETIRGFGPVLSISAYHCGDQHRVLPSIVESIRPDYDLIVDRAARGLELKLSAVPIGQRTR